MGLVSIGGVTREYKGIIWKIFSEPGTIKDSNETQVMATGEALVILINSCSRKFLVESGSRMLFIW